MNYELAIKIIDVAMMEVEWNYPLDYKDAFNVAIECVEKQIPKLVKINGKYTKDFGIEPYDQVFCPSCGKRIRVKYKGKFCDKCGQKLKWSEVE